MPAAPHQPDSLDLLCDALIDRIRARTAAVEPPPPDRPAAMSRAQAAEALGVSEDLIGDMQKRGELPCIRLGRRWMIPAKAIDLILEATLVDWNPAIAAQRLGAYQANPRLAVVDGSAPALPSAPGAGPPGAARHRKTS